MGVMVVKDLECLWSDKWTKSYAVVLFPLIASSRVDQIIYGKAFGSDG